MPHTSSDDQVLSEIGLSRCLKEMRKNDEPLSWEFVKKYFKSENFYAYRSSSVEKAYKQSKASINKTWDDISSQIKHEVFGMKSSTVNSSFVEKRTVEEPIKNNLWKLTPNKFPHLFEDGVESYVLWYANKDESESKFKEWIAQCEELEHCDLIVYENSPSYKSVKLIPHLHILAREVEKGKTRIIMF